MTLRTRLLAAAALVAAVCCGACGAPSAPAGPDPAGAASSPADPGVVVALDDFAAVNVLALGVVPDVAYATFGYATSEALYADAGVEPKAYGQSLDVESVAASNPDVIIGTSLPTTVSSRAALERLAPTTVLEYTADWKTALRATAKALGRSDRGREVEAAVQRSITTLAGDLESAGKQGAVVSAVAGSPDAFFSLPVGTNLGALLAELGLERPEAQQAEVSADSPFVPISAENLPDHDGDALYLMKGRSYPVEPVTGSPLYPRLRAVQDDRVYEVSGEMWFGSNPLSVQWVVDDVRATLLEGRGPLREDQAGERLAALVDATGG